MAFGFLKRVAKGAAREVSAEYSKNKDFLEACCAGAALIASADGTISDVEKRQAVSVVTRNPTLGKLYQHNEIEQCMATMLDRAGSASGRQSLVREIGEIKSSPNAPQMAEDVYLIAADVASADGEIGEKEKRALEKLAAIIGVDPNKFEF